MIGSSRVMAAEEDLITKVVATVDDQEEEDITAEMEVAEVL